MTSRLIEGPPLMTNSMMTWLPATLTPSLLASMMTNITTCLSIDSSKLTASMYDTAYNKYIKGSIEGKLKNLWNNMGSVVYFWLWHFPLTSTPSLRCHNYDALRDSVFDLTPPTITSLNIPFFILKSPLRPWKKSGDLHVNM